MSINSKQKGKRGELEVVQIFRDAGFPAERTAQYCGNNPEGIADVRGVPGVHIEVKRVEHINIDDALDQSKRDAGKTDGGIPIVVHRRSGKCWKVTMDAKDWIVLFKKARKME